MYEDMHERLYEDGGLHCRILGHSWFNFNPTTHLRDILNEYT